jgi:toxin ParE1/3/4
MPSVIYSSEAERDIRQITQYIARDNVTAALAWIGELEATCRLLATQPASGGRVDAARFAETRRHVVGSYLIYYLPVDDGIGVVRVVHGARDQDKLR